MLQMNPKHDIIILIETWIIIQEQTIGIEFLNKKKIQKNTVVLIQLKKKNNKSKMPFLSCSAVLHSHKYDIIIIMSYNKIKVTRRLE